MTRPLGALARAHLLLGTLTTREMFFFTAYHALHHVQSAKRRLPRFAADAAP